MLAARGAPQLKSRPVPRHEQRLANGAGGSVREQALASMVTQMPVRFETSTDDPWLNAVVIRADAPMHAVSIEQVLEPAPGVV